VLRIRQIVQLAERGPLLFLLDELLHGTNSHDRRIGAGAILRSLLDRDAIGLATTHDLALSDIVQELAPRAENVHFQDEIRDGQITFDYLMRAGVVTKSNALELMRSVGLDV
jgi:DNA mismatch repair ATPase MutS